MGLSLEFVLKAIAAASALAGLFLGLAQYYRAQRWKMAEFAAKELEKLNNDPLLSLACTLLDWEGRTFGVPETYRYKSENSSFIHTWKILEKAMVPSITPDDGQDGFTEQEVMYRDIFDHLFTYLELMNHYVEIKLIRSDDISILKYWFQQIAGSELAHGKPIFQKFLQKFEYIGVNSLSKKLNVNPDNG